MSAQTQSNDINSIMDFLMKKDDEYSQNVKLERIDLGYDMNMPDHFLEDPWPSSSDELLENIFSLESGGLLGPSEGSSLGGSSLAGSDSGLSMDHADLDMLELLGGPAEEALSPLSSPAPPAPQSPCSPTIRYLPSAESAPPKRKLEVCDVTDTGEALPKIQKHYISRPGIAGALQSRNVSSSGRVLRLAPGHPRSILLPVTIKDVKELRAIKIIDATDLPHAPAIKLAAASFLRRARRRSAASSDEGGSGGEGSGCEGGGAEGSGGEGRRFPRLRLTAEERRLLQREGVALPERYPLTRLEERELKRIRRKIRNKISAQDSRRRKKEYVDGLEDRVKQCTEENQTLIKRIKTLQTQNTSLTAQLRKLQTLVSGGVPPPGGPATPAGGTGPAPATCLLVLLLSLALVVAPSLRPPAPLGAPAAAHQQLLSSVRRALLSAPAPSLASLPPLPPEEAVLAEHSYPRKPALEPLLLPPGKGAGVVALLADSGPPLLPPGKGAGVGLLLADSGPPLLPSQLNITHTRTLVVANPSLDRGELR